MADVGVVAVGVAEDFLLRFVLGALGASVERNQNKAFLDSIKCTSYATGDIPTPTLILKYVDKKNLRINTQQSV